MVENSRIGRAILRSRSPRLFHSFEPLLLPSFPIQAVEIDWDRLIAKRPTVLETIDAMPVYLLKPEVLALLDEDACFAHLDQH